MNFFKQLAISKCEHGLWRTELALVTSSHLGFCHIQSQLLHNSLDNLWCYYFLYNFSTKHFYLFFCCFKD